ncbi:hypothetical protein FLACOL7796_02517 [Flavobacterium collinsii]|uniref:Photosynthesis system II assembly factor Ycf48/Hcf136-like domain-containing protein n=2 Tax=Flavobacterium collinsii TaxID=1114861 RepID=A0ABN7EK17_9FLAO|nr:hypothetical protein FLACOL7796_02517 [Flavobacterium collinsii]
MYFTSLVADSANQAFFAGHLYIEGSEPSITRVMIYRDAQWFHLYDLDEIAYTCEGRAPSPGKPRGDLCFLGRRGLFRQNSRGQQPMDSYLKPKVGYFYCLKEIAGSLYATGTQNQLFRYDGSQWHEQDQGIFAPLVDQVNRTFNALDGFGADDIYAVGFRGQICHWDGQHWRELQSPTNLPLNAVLCAPDGQVYISGSGGTLFRGSAVTGWQDIGENSLSDRTFESLAYFQERLYIAAGQKLLTFDGVLLQECQIPMTGETPYFVSLDAAPDALWTAGNDCLLCFDGSTWVRHVCP